MKKKQKGRHPARAPTKKNSKRRRKIKPKALVGKAKTKHKEGHEIYIATLIKTDQKHINATGKRTE